MGVFHISPIQDVEAIASFIPIYFYLNKLIGCYYLCIASLSKQHVINSLLDSYYFKQATSHYMAISHLTLKQSLKVKSPIMNINHHLNQVYLVFNSLDKELSSGFQLVDIFPNCFLINIVNCKDAKAKSAYFNKLDNIYKDSFNSSDTVLIISSTNIKDNIATLVSHI